MARGISLHIGLNEVDPNVYGDKLELGGCVNDANDMQRIAQNNGYETSILLNSQATSTNVVQQITQAAIQLQNGDIFLITYSGHGSSIPDNTGDESDGNDEAWVLFNRQFLDDELYELWTHFREGVRLFVLSDSCHSGTMLKNFTQLAKAKRSIRSRSVIAEEFDEQILRTVENSYQTIHKIRMAPISISFQNYSENISEYKEIQYRLRNIKSQSPLASLILISGCQDSEFSMDYGTNGLFTSQLKETWNAGAFRGSYSNFHTSIAQKVSAQEPTQNPNLMMLGKNTQPFISNIPFIINAPGWPISISSGSTASNGTSGNSSSANSGSGLTVSENGQPSISVPPSWDPSNGIPEFSIYKGSNPYYYIEVVTDQSLFDYDQWKDHGNFQNSFMSWHDESTNNQLTTDKFSLPIHAWNQLRYATTLYVRIGTTSSALDNQWENHEVSEIVAMHLSTSSTNNSTNGHGNGSENGNQNISLNQGDSLTGSVGKRGENDPADVLKIQGLLNKVPHSEGGPANPLVEDGIYGSNTNTAIVRFQRTNDIETSGLIRPVSTTYSILKLKSNEYVLCS